MANSPQARKRARQENRHRARNMAQRGSMRTHIKRCLKAADAGTVETADHEYRLAVSQIDRAARKGLHHPNKASRIKKRLNMRLKNVATAAES